MKTPRELLFEQHENARPDLDQIRRDVVKRLALEARPSANRSQGLSWLMDLLPSAAWRYQLAGLAAAWLMILALNLVASDGPSVAPAHHRAGSGPTLNVAWREYRRQLSDALESQPAVTSAGPGQRSLLRPFNPEPVIVIWI